MTQKIELAQVQVLHVKGAGKGGWQTSVKITVGKLILATGKLYGKYDEHQIRQKFKQNPNQFTIAPTFKDLNPESIKALVA